MTSYYTVLHSIFYVSICFSTVTGLVCSVLLQKLSKKAKNVEEHSLTTDLTEHAKYSKTLFSTSIFNKLFFRIINLF